jgi:hypothetical protein
MAKFKVTVPIDASAIADVDKGHPLKVVARDAKGKTQSQIVKLDDRKATATFTFDERPSGLRVFVAPQDVPDEDVDKLQTVAADVNARLLTKNDVTIPAITIAPFYWQWWLRWCRTFTIHGRLLCADGSPVPGAQICAYDVDWFWWWQSTQQVGCATTAADGSFEIKFRWCCGWWPWWWWRLRNWQIDRNLYARIIEKLPPELKIRRIPLPDPVPDLKVFQSFLPQANPVTVRPGIPQILDKVLPQLGNVLGNATQQSTPIDLTVVEKLREPLAARLPKIAEADTLRIWPWFPWSPWFDCAPDIVFRATQDCTQQGAVILEPGRPLWDIGTDTTVTLQANEKACCVARPHDGDGCLTITDVCRIPANHVGTDGYANSGTSDNPFAGTIDIRGEADNMTNVDYYQFVYEYFDPSTSTWGPETPVPPGSAGAFARLYIDHSMPPHTWQSAPFPPLLIDGRTVYESLPHYEATHPPNNWNSPAGRQWHASEYDELMPWVTSRETYADGLYRLHVKGYKLVAGHLVPEDLFICNERTPSYVHVRLDNRFEPDPSHATGPGHSCGAGTVHLCVTEPDCDIVSVALNGGAPFNACSIQGVRDTDTVDVTFFVTDPDGHLGGFTLEATWGENLRFDVLSCGTLDTVPSGGPVMSQYTHQPDGIWPGGTYRVSVPGHCFRDTCCYQLTLHAWKRTIINCSSPLHENWSTFSFMVNKV